MISVGRVVQADGAADDRWIAAELLPPERRADHRDGRARFVDGLGIGAPEDRRGAEDVEEAGRRLHAAHANRLAAAGEVDDVLAVSGDARQHRRIALHVEIVRGRERGVDALRRRAGDAKDTVGLRVGKRPQHHAINEAEDGGGAADAERERDQRDEREARHASKRSEGVPQVLTEYAHGRSTLTRQKAEGKRQKRPVHSLRLISALCLVHSAFSKPSRRRSPRRCVRRRGARRGRHGPRNAGRG